MLRLLAERLKAGVEIRMFGKVGKGVSGIDARKLPDLRLHVRAIVRDGAAVFIGSQSLRKLELDGRREVGVIASDERIAKKMRDVFEADWAQTAESEAAAAAGDKEKEKDKDKDAEKEKATSDA
jgi:phosphatidylserine/phosphatidylglycerophosphate/cardiolipin synthase-like enzyme